MHESCIKIEITFIRGYLREPGSACGNLKQAGDYNHPVFGIKSTEKNKCHQRSGWERKCYLFIAWKEPERRQPAFFDSLVYEIQNNGQLIVIHTRPGTANTVAKFIDDHGFEEVLGSVAGDDTIIIVPSDINRISQIVKRLQSYLNKIGIF